VHDAGLHVLPVHTSVPVHFPQNTVLPHPSSTEPQVSPWGQVSNGLQVVPQPSDCLDQPEVPPGALHLYVLSSVPQVVSPQLTVTGTLP
jgi:hypothetical protein